MYFGTYKNRKSLVTDKDTAVFSTYIAMNKIKMIKDVLDALDKCNKDLFPNVTPSNICNIACHIV